MASLENEKAWMIDFRVVVGKIVPSFMDRDFIPQLPIPDWEQYRIFGIDKNEVIDEIIAKLVGLKDS